MSTIITKVAKAENMDMSFLSNYFIEFFKDKPWNEYLYCPKCKNTDDFGPGYSWGINEYPQRCPSCRSKLEIFWSEKRVRCYLTKKPTICFEAIVNNNLAAWSFGYEISPSDFYIDTATILPEYRKDPGTRVFLERFDYFLKIINENGYTRIISRTHKKSKVARRVLAVLGFIEGCTSKEDPNRSYWIRETEAYY